MLARPLTNILKQVSFEWSGNEHKAFEQLKQAMMSALLLALPDFDKVFVVLSDASGNGLGVVLMQDQRPIAYFSKGLTDRER